MIISQFVVISYTDRKKVILFPWLTTRTMQHVEWTLCAVYFFSLFYSIYLFSFSRSLVRSLSFPLSYSPSHTGTLSLSLSFTHYLSPCLFSQPPPSSFSPQYSTNSIWPAGRQAPLIRLAVGIPSILPGQQSTAVRQSSGSSATPLRGHPRRHDRSLMKSSPWGGGVSRFRVPRTQTTRSSATAVCDAAWRGNLTEEMRWA